MCFLPPVSLAKMPMASLKFSSVDPPAVVGISFAADIMRRHHQYILLVRETVTSWTDALLLADEGAATVYAGLVIMCVGLRPADGAFAVIRTDAASGFRSLIGDRQLSECHLSIEIGRSKKVNKSPVAEHAIQELQEELMHGYPLGGPVSPSQLARAVVVLNLHIRAHGLSARGMTQRDQFTGDQLPVADSELVLAQHKARGENHDHSVCSKFPSACDSPGGSSVSDGDMVYLRAERGKHPSRPRYLIASVDGEWASVRKFVGRQLRAMSYHVRLADCVRVAVPDQVYIQSLVCHDSGDECELGAIPDNAAVPLDKPSDVPEEFAPPVVQDAVLDTLCALESPSEDATQKPKVHRRSGRTRKRPDLWHCLGSSLLCGGGL